MIEIKNAIRMIQNNDALPVYYLKGNDQFLHNFFIEKLCDSIFAENKIIKSLLTPNEMSGKEIIEQILFSDLFNTQKLFILRDPQQLKGKAVKDLLDYCSNPIPNHFLVLINDNFMDNSSFSKSVMKNVDPINASTPFTRDLSKWARFFFKENNKKAEPSIIEELVENFGDSLYNIKNEIDKLCLLNNNAIIKASDINSPSSWIRSRQRWELMSSIGNRDLERSISLSKEIIGDSDTMISLIYPLTAFFQEILYAKMNNGTFVNPKSYIPLSNSIKNNISTFASRYDKQEIEKSIRELKNIETRQKTSNSDDESDLINFIYNVIG
jgi:DNA polymerase III delta subunit